MLSGLVGLIPQFHATLPPVAESGGRTLADLSNIAGMAAGVGGSILRNKASASQTIATYERRQEDWDLQI